MEGRRRRSEGTAAEWRDGGDGAKERRPNGGTEGMMERRNDGRMEGRETLNGGTGVGREDWRIDRTTVEWRDG